MRHSSSVCVWFVVAAALSSMPAIAQPAPEEIRQLDRLSSECREVWFKGKALTAWEKHRQFADVRADRQLTPEERDCVLKVSDAVVDRAFYSRTFLADWLGDMGHAYCIPALLAVLRDETENPELRARCAFALAHIADPRVVEPLIDALGDQDPDVGQQAWEQLAKVFKYKDDDPPLDRHPGIKYNIGWQRVDRDWIKRMQDEYRQWWSANANRVEMNRAATYWAH